MCRVCRAPGLSSERSNLNKLLGLIGLTVGGWLGWVIGARLSFAAAIFLSTVGTALGLYIGRRIAQEYF